MDKSRFLSNCNMSFIQSDFWTWIVFKTAFDIAHSEDMDYDDAGCAIYADQCCTVEDFQNGQR